MERAQAMIAGGLGCKRGCAADEIVRALELALASAARTLTDVGTLYAPEWKREEAGLARAAEQVGKPLVFLPLATLQAQAHAALSDSAQTKRRFGLPSVAETAALAGALSLAPARHAPRLLGPRQVAGTATCALAENVFKEQP
jgi:cobalt-precorrin 5A hydrolase